MKGFLFLFCLLSFPLSAQIYTLSDSTLVALSKEAGHSDQLNALEELCFREAHRSKSKLTMYALKALALSDNPAFQAKIYNHLSLGELAFGELDSSLNFARMALTLREKVGDSLELASSFTRIGQIYKEKGAFEEAASYLFKALKIFERQGYKSNAAKLLDNIGALFKENMQLDEAVYYHQKSFDLALEAGDSTTAALALGNVAVVFLKQQNFYEALKINHTALSGFYNFIDSVSISVLYQNIGVCHASMGQSDSSLYYYNKAAQLYRKMENLQGLASILPNIGNQWALKKDFKKQRHI